ncbi:selenocysteine-specific translation elongation factor, partial [Cumulibacter manganitolerans]|uniref:selenocysteine-specific translation elongation factor n=1 Tax=Cumulibacter manganitolerans TaxID=1884992 RepID=UPI001E39A7E8
MIATAGHVDHGKSALVRALTGIEPDRWDEERRRGLTIDLGFAWTTLPSGTDLSFVDVPGHQRFIGNMLAGLGPAAAVMVVVAADEGWRAQTEEHLLAIDALGIRNGLLVVTRSDLADPGTAMRAARDRIAASSLGDVEAVAVSARTGDGVADVRSALDRLIGALPPAPAGPARMWLDRAFTIRGAGTVVTGTLGQGELATGSPVDLVSATGDSAPDVRIRGLHSRDLPVTSIAAVSRVAVNLAGIEADRIGRGGVLLTGSWSLTDVLDVRVTGVRAGELPEQLMLHVGTHAAQVRVRPLGDDAARLQLTAALPLREGDRAILRNPGLQHVVAGAEVLDAAPPALRRRGSAAQRGVVLGQGAGSPASLAWSTLQERGVLRHAELVRLGLDEAEPRGTRRVGDWVVTDAQWSSWAALLRALVTAQRDADPLEPGVTENAAAAELRLPERAVLAALAGDAGA